jgi:molecular chaperone GrpE
MIDELALEKAREKLKNGDTAPQEELTLEEALEENPKDTEIQDLKDQLLRALADGENARKRFERERDELKKYSITSFARDLLNVGDNLGRALESSPNATDVTPETLKAFLEGVEMTERELLNILDRHGIKKIHPEGEPFNHEHHQAMFEVESPDHGPGIVAQVLQPGYLIHDRLLRPALVGVTKKQIKEEVSS